jgi:hypothetical protein
MTPNNRTTTFRMDDELFEAMERLRQRDGILFSEQIRRALLMFHESKGIAVSKPAPKPKKK